MPFYLLFLCKTTLEQRQVIAILAELDIIDARTLREQQTRADLIGTQKGCYGSPAGKG